MRVPSTNSETRCLLRIALVLAVFADVAVSRPIRGPIAPPSDAVNLVLGDTSFVQTFGRPPTPADGEDLRIRTHLRYVETRLRALDVSELPIAQQEARRQILDQLDSYTEAGVFPRNRWLSNRRPCFVDDAGNVCAVGFLIEQTIGRDVVEQINEEYQYAALAQIDTPILDDWLREHGLTRIEAAMIQPGYGVPEPVDDELYFSASPSADNRCIYGPPFTPFQFYVTVTNATALIRSYEGSFTMPSPPTLLIVSEVVLGQDPVNSGSLANFIVETATCFSAQTRVALIAYTAMILTPVLPRINLCFGPSSPSHFVPAAPGYWACDGTQVPFGFREYFVGVPANCAALNVSCVVGTAETSWSAVKAAFRSE